MSKCQGSTTVQINVIDVPAYSCGKYKNAGQNVRLVAMYV